MEMVYGWLQMRAVCPSAREDVQAKPLFARAGAVVSKKRMQVPKVRTASDGRGQMAEKAGIRSETYGAGEATR